MFALLVFVVEPNWFARHWTNVTSLEFAIPPPDCVPILMPTTAPVAKMEIHVLLMTLVLLVCATADQRKFAQHWINVTFLEFAIQLPEIVPTLTSAMANFAMMEMLALN